VTIFIDRYDMISRCAIFGFILLWWDDVVCVGLQAKVGSLNEDIPMS